MENKLRDVVRCSLVFFMEKISLGGGEEKISTKNERGRETITHKNEHEMERISPLCNNPSTYFTTSHINQLYHFPSYYQIDLKCCIYVIL